MASGMTRLVAKIVESLFLQTGPLITGHVFTHYVRGGGGSSGLRVPSGPR